MAGLYIHIPFCTQRCLYCDFYSNTDMSLKEAFVSAVCKEMEMRKSYPGGESIETIYFGGGTPSQLAIVDFERIFNTIYALFPVSENAEITLEANPDDMTEAYTASLRTLPFNRLSMGVQSFHEDDLRFLQRRHTVDQAAHAVSLCKENGFQNISLDLIYGLPGQTVERWEVNIEQFLSLNVPHLSAYHLIYEEGTRLYRLKEAGSVQPIDEDTSVALFNTLINKTTEAGYIHYEISNFSRPGMFSKHNSSYWQGKKYLGVGPSAHSYDIESRQWNVSSLKQYIQGIHEGIPKIEREMLNLPNQYNDYIITGLRTMWGISLSFILTHFGEERHNYCLAQASTFIKEGLLIRNGDNLLLSRDGVFVSDSVMSDLLWV